MTNSSEKPKTLPTSPSFILEREIMVSPKQRKFINALLEDARIIQNTVVGMAKKRYDQMLQSDEYKKQYTELKNINEQINNEPKNEKLKAQRKEIMVLLREINRMFRLTKCELEKDAKSVRAYYHNRLDSVATQKAANRAWISINELIMKKAKRIHFLKYGENTSIEGKSNGASVVMECENNELKVRYGKEYFRLKPAKKNDLYMKEAVSNVVSYLNTSIDENPDIQFNAKLGNSYLNEEITKEYYLKNFKSTYRVKYSRIVKKVIRGRERFYVQMVLEGHPIPKRKQDGTFRHQLGTGRVGNDFGTQTVGVVSDEKVELMNLAEDIEKIDHRIKKLQRKMDRSRRNANPNNYKADGTLQKGKKIRVYSKRYIKLRAKLRELHRKNTVKRRLAHETLVNQLVSLGDTFYGEKMSFKGLQKRKKETEKSEKGKFKKKKRFGKSLAHKAPALFVKLYKDKVEQLGGTFLFVNTQKFKASQYDHTTQKAVKKQLSERWHVFSDGTKIQRDLYSGFLLKCSNETLDKPDFVLCKQEFISFKEKHDGFIEQTVVSKKIIINSGIKIGK